ncbi:hypothetical protein EU527_06420 [Candidatus Thorarchaeota archaeon]|nr:MAG: hypothetical protein EU527_06420 [Candidatus Thorarchaeota archaeon]
MSTTFTTIIDDMKTSLKMAYRTALSYFLAHLGMLIVVALLALLIAIPVAAVAWIALAPFSEVTMEAMAAWFAENPLVIGGIGILVMIPLISMFLVVSGSVYGMSYDLVTTGDTKAERAFSYLRHKFLTFLSTGAVLTIIVVLPPVIVWGLTSFALGYAIPTAISALLSAFTFVWVFITAGLTSMVFPAVSGGKGVQDSFKESFSLSTRYFDRVYGTLSAVILLLAITFGPVIALGIALAPYTTPTLIPWAFLPAIAFVAIYTVICVFLWLLLFLPMVRIAWVRVYQDLTGGEIAPQTAVDIPIV